MRSINLSAHPVLLDEAAELRENLSKLDSDAIGDILDAGRALLDCGADTETIMADAYRLAKLRIKAKRNGVAICKNFYRTFGDSGYMLRDLVADIIIAGADPVPFSLTLDAVEGWISCMEGNDNE